MATDDFILNRHDENMVTKRKKMCICSTLLNCELPLDNNYVCASIFPIGIFRTPLLEMQIQIIHHFGPIEDCLMKLVPQL